MAFFPRLPTCNHSAAMHLIFHPYCSEIPGWKKVRNLCLHLFLGYCVIQLLYSLYSNKDRVKKMTPQKKEVHPLNQEIDTAYQVAQAAFKQAKAGRLPKGTSTFMPCNAQIPRLVAAFFTEFNKWIEMLGPNPQPWEQHAVSQQAFKTLQISYVLSCLVLEDLPKFKTQHKIDSDHATILQDPNYYFYKTVLQCASCYHYFRSAALKQNGHWVQTSTPPEKHADQFYIPGTEQARARTLYNRFLTLLEQNQYIESLRLTQNRHWEPWLQYDPSLQKYASPVGTYPIDLKF